MDNGERPNRLIRADLEDELVRRYADQHWLAELFERPVVKLGWRYRVAMRIWGIRHWLADLIYPYHDEECL